MQIADFLNLNILSIEKKKDREKENLKLFNRLSSLFCRIFLVIRPLTVEVREEEKFGGVGHRKR